MRGEVNEGCCKTLKGLTKREKIPFAEEQNKYTES